jgi:hypothetical protein
LKPQEENHTGSQMKGHSQNTRALKITQNYFHVMCIRYMQDKNEFCLHLGPTHKTSHYVHASIPESKKKKKVQFETLCVPSIVHK